MVFEMLPLMAFGGKQFHCYMQMSCDHELANEWAHNSRENASYITIFIHAIAQSTTEYPLYLFDCL